MKNSFLKLFCRIGLIFSILCSLEPYIYAGDTITIQSPSNNFQFLLGEAQNFRWTPIGTQVKKKYIIKLVVVNQDQSAEEAMLNNDVWYCDTTDFTTSVNTYYYTDLYNKSFPLDKKMAWQVKAVDESDKVYSQSAIFTFYKKSSLGAFRTEKRWISVDNVTENSYGEVSGSGSTNIIFTINGVVKKRKLPVTFKGVKVYYSSGEIFMVAGKVSGELIDTFIHNPENKVNGSVKFYADSFIMDKDHDYVQGTLKWETDLLEKKEISIYSKVGIDDDYTLLGSINLPNISSKVVGMENTSLRIDSTSYFFFRWRGSYFMELNGKVSKIFSNGNVTMDTISFSFSKIDNLEFFPLSVSKNQNSIILNDILKVYPLEAFFDNSTTKSPGTIFDLNWKGISINKFDLAFNIANKRYSFKPYLEKIPFQLKDKSKLTFTDNNLQLSLDTVFASPGLECSYNGFKGCISAININRPYSLNLSNQISGSITIPYLPSPNKLNYVVNLNETAVVDSLVEKVEDFTFNDVSKNSITSFYVFNGDEKIPGVIDETAKTIRFSLPQGADIKNVKSYFTTTGVQVRVSTVDQVRGETVNDFTKTLIYQVRSGEGIFENYKVSENLHTANNNIEEFSNIRVYPNPATSKLYFEGIPSNSIIYVYSMDGRLMMQSNCNEALELYIDRLTTGLYLLKITNKEEEHNFKFTKE